MAFSEASGSHPGGSQGKAGLTDRRLCCQGCPLAPPNPLPQRMLALWGQEGLFVFQNVQNSFVLLILPPLAALRLCDEATAVYAFNLT